MATNTILLDVGGTFVKSADGRQTPIASDGSREAIAAALKAALKMPGHAGHDGTVTPDLRGGLKGIGVAIPGPFDYRQGIFLMKHKFAAVYGESFRSLAGIPDGIPVVFMHDVNAPLAGAIKMLRLEHGNTALITLGTGLGFSYALRGEIQCDANGSPAKSLWNLPLDGGGILEDKISARGILAAYATQTGESGQSVLDIARRAYAGEAAAQKVFSNLGECLGDALKEIVQELRIDTLLMGGQISKSLSLMLEPLQSRLSEVRILPLPEGAVFEGLASSL